MGPAASPAAALPAGRDLSTDRDRLGSGDAKRREGVEADVEVEDEEVVVEVDLDEGARR